MGKSNRIIPNELIPKRLDAEYYEKPYRHTEQLIRCFENVTTLEKVRLDKVPIRRGIDMPKIISKANSPVLVTIASFEEPGINFDGLERIERKQHDAFHGSALEAGDLIVAMGGYPGRAAICPPNTPASNIGRHTARVVIDLEKADKYYIWAFIRSTPGTLQFAREVTGSVQAGINLEDLREVLISEPHRTVQTYIGDKVRQAERLRERSRDFADKINFLILTNDIQEALEIRELKCNRPKVEDIELRLDPKYYNRRAMGVSKACSQKSTPISNLIISVSNGFEHRQFVKEGFPYITVSEVSSGRLNLDNAPQISSSVQVPVKARICSCCVLVVRTGSIGTAVKVYQEEKMLLLAAI